MIFSRRLKPSSDYDITVPGHAAICMASAFWMCNLREGREIASPNLHLLLGISESKPTLEALSNALPANAALWLKQTLQELRAGKQPEQQVLEMNDGRSVQAVPHLLNSPQGFSEAAVVWFYEASKHARLQQENSKLKGELKHYSTILNMAPYPIWERGSDLNVRFYNLAYGEIAEESGEGAAPELDRRARTLASNALETSQPKSERRHIVVGGQRKLYHFNEMPLREEKMVVGFAQDISEIEMLHSEMERYKSAQDDLLESSASAMAIYGPDMRLKSFNYAFVSLWKLDETWLESEPMYGEILENLREKRVLPEQANFQMFKQTQLKLFTGLIEPREEFFYLPDGKTLRVIAIPHALGGILFAYEDVTNRLALERSYNTLIAVQRETLDNLHEGIAVFGEDGRLKLFNPVYLAMWEVDEPLAHTEPHINTLVDHAKHLYQFGDAWDQFREKRINQIHTRNFVQQRLERSDGKVIDCTTVPLPDGATLVTYLDVTASMLVERSLRERNDALQEADRLKTEFLANVSYELRSPLTSISGFSDMLKQEYFGGLNDKQKEYVEGINQSAQHLMQLVNDILDLASVEAGYMQIEMSKFDIAPMMKEVLALSEERAKLQDMKLDLECPPKIGKMTGDEIRIKQSLVNLLGNAVRYSTTGGHITLGSREEGKEWIIFWVQDDGPGIPVEEQPFVFNKFYRGKNREVPKARAKSGTGLGLSIVKSFIELHGGSVELTSERGGGTRIECRMPRNGVKLSAAEKKKG